MPAQRVDPGGQGRSLPLARLERESLRDRVVEAIRNAIVEGRLGPGQKIPEDELAAQLGVSRTPIREAIRILEQHGLVQVQPKTGTYIAAVDGRDEANALAVRSVLEELAIREAIERSSEAQWAHLCGQLEQLIIEMGEAVDRGDPVTATELDIAFHTTLIQASNNRYLFQTWRLVGVPFLIWSPERGLYPQSRQEMIVGLTERHSELLEALRTRNADLAAGAVQRHIGRKLTDIAGGPVGRSAGEPVAAGRPDPGATR